MTNRTEQFAQRGKLISIGVKLYPDQLEWLREAFPDNYNGALRRMIDEWKATRGTDNAPKET